MAIVYDGLWQTMASQDVTFSDLRKSLKLSSNTLTKFRKEESVSIKTLEKICDYLHCDIGDIISFVPDASVDNVPRFSISSRRYLGNKYRLLSFITSVLQDNIDEIESVADIFSGTGAVASAFTDKVLITNDIMYCNYMCNVAWFSSQHYDEKKLLRLLAEYNKKSIDEKNYMSENFSDTYFSRQDCSKIGYVREDIERLYKAKTINFRERAILITSLIYAMDKIANTCGHYDAYIRGAEFTRNLILGFPRISTKNNALNKNFNEDANELVRKIKVDLIYVDPPYNSRQYCDAYHVLENVAKWKKPEVFGVAKKMSRDGIKSDYCRRSAPNVFKDLINHIDAKYILLSYNNMGDKGDNRSNARISDDVIYDTLQAYGDLKVFSQDHRLFSAGRSHIKGNSERLFLCTREDGQ